MTRIAHELQHLDAGIAAGWGKPSSDFDLNPEAAPPDAELRDAAVLIPLIALNDRLEVILTRRAAGMKHHPGQIAFPGGKVDPGDASSQAAALREAHEEIGLDPAQVTMRGALDAHRTVTSFLVQPHVGLIEGSFEPRAEPGEVAEVFSVPLSHLMDPDNYLVEGRIWMGRRRQYYVVPWGPYYIWGATARMLRALADRVGPLP